MSHPVPAHIGRFARAVGPEPDEVLAEMEDYGRHEGFPIIGPEAGGWLRMLATLVDARRVFEFGSGFGYSAYWFAGALPEDGRIVLTEVDRDELDLAREYLDRGGFADRASFEHGDAIDIVDGYDGPFDVALIDNEKARYAEAFEAVRGKVRAGGVVVADNAMAAGDLIDFDDLLAAVEGEGSEPRDEHTLGIARYIARVRDDPGFETVILPIGSGLVVSRREDAATPGGP